MDAPVVTARCHLAVDGWERHEHRHHPYFRHVRTAWHRDEHGRWLSEPCEDATWEIVCTECGDTEGPADEQTLEVRKLRGPYLSHHKARSAAHRHERKENPPLSWTPGSTSRIPL